jgi:hypothetical protein
LELKSIFIAAAVSAQAAALANLAGAVTEPGLASSLTGVVSAITDLGSSLAGLETLLTGRRVKRETISNNQKIFILTNFKPFYLRLRQSAKCHRKI